MVQLFGYDQEITVHLYLKSTLAPVYKEYASQSLKLNAVNNYQASATLRVGLQIWKKIPEENFCMTFGLDML